jgi:hypothetical protein
MRRKLFFTMLAAAALALPSAALADHGGGHGGNHGHHGGGRATFELKGTLSAFTPAAGATNGSITIHVLKANDAGRPFVGMTLTFPVSPATEVETRNGTIANGDSGEVQLKGPFTTDPAVLQTMAPRKVQDQGANPGVGAGQVVYKLEGTLSAFTPSSGATNGSITIHVLEANTAGKPFIGMTLTFPVSPATEVESDGAIATGDRGEIQIKGAPGLSAAALQLLAPREIEDEANDD